MRLGEINERASIEKRSKDSTVSSGDLIFRHWEDEEEIHKRDLKGKTNEVGKKTGACIIRNQVKKYFKNRGIITSVYYY